MPSLCGYEGWASRRAQGVEALADCPIAILDGRARSRTPASEMRFDRYLLTGHQPPPDPGWILARPRADIKYLTEVVGLASMSTSPRSDGEVGICGIGTLSCSASSHEALLALAVESCGSPSLVRAAKEMVDQKLWAEAHTLLARAEIYAAFWSDRAAGVRGSDRACPRLRRERRGGQG